MKPSVKIPAKIVKNIPSPTKVSLPTKVPPKTSTPVPPKIVAKVPVKTLPKIIKTATPIHAAIVKKTVSQASSSQACSSSACSSSQNDKEFPPPTAEQEDLILARVSDDIIDMLNTKEYMYDKLKQLSWNDLGLLAWLDKDAAKYIALKFNIYPLPIDPLKPLMPHQEKACRWLSERENNIHMNIRGGMLKLDPGLGKTIISLAYDCLSVDLQQDFPILKVCSKTVVNAWKKEVNKFFGDRLKVLYLHADHCSSIASLTIEDIRSYHIVVTTYETVMTSYQSDLYDSQVLVTTPQGSILAIAERQPHQLQPHFDTGIPILHCIKWHRITADESQKFCNVKPKYTKRFIAIMGLIGKYKCCLTGTPIRNYNTDIWVQMRFMGYDKIVNKTKWAKQATKFFNDDKLNRSILQMNYEDAGIVLPTRYIHTIEIPLEQEEKELYLFVLGIMKEGYNLVLKDHIGFQFILTIFMRLRQTCLAGHLIVPASKRKKNSVIKVRVKELNVLEQDLLNRLNLLTESLSAWAYNKFSSAGIHSSKIRTIVGIIDDVDAKYNGQDKLIIFSKFTSFLDLIALSLEHYLPETKYIQLDGDVKGAERVNVLEEFDSDPEIKVMLASYDVASEGLTMTKASHAVFSEPWYTPAVHSQSGHRIWRIGQNKDVHMYVLMATCNEAGVEKHIVNICHKKKKMARDMLNGEMSDIQGAGLNKETLGQILDM